MTQLHGEVNRNLLAPDGLDRLLDSPGASGLVTTETAVDYGTTAALAAIGHMVKNPSDFQRLQNLVHEIDHRQIDGSNHWTETLRSNGLGNQMTQALYQSGANSRHHQAVISNIGARAMTSPEDTAAIVGASAWMVLAVLVRRSGYTLDRMAIDADLASEKQVLADHGWEPWMSSIEAGLQAGANSLAGSQSTTTTASARSRVDEMPIAPAPQRFPAGNTNLAEAAQGLQTNAPLPSHRQTTSQSFSSPGSAPLNAPPHSNTGQSSTYGSGGSAAGGFDPVTDRYGTQAGVFGPQGDDEHQWQESKPSRLPLILGLLLLAGFVGVGGLWAATNWENLRGETIASGETGTAAASVTSAVNESAESPVEQPASPEVASDGRSYTGIVTFAVPMTDIFGVKPDASGSADLTINSMSGEICVTYTTTSFEAPYISHIHLGNEGVRGPAVIQWADYEFTDGDRQCTLPSLDEVQRLFVDLSDYYVEVHPMDFSYSIRGQLDQAQINDDRDPNAPTTVEAERGAIFETDPASDGAQVQVEEGRLVVTGPVGSQEAKDQLLSSLDAAEVDIINGVTIEEGAVASGKLVATEGLNFESSSAELENPDTEVLDIMTRLLKANPDWNLTIVGHTDSSGDDVLNFGLSFDRAETVRSGLEERGVANRMSVAGFGSAQPVASNETEEGKRQNRRIEFVIDPV